MLAIDLLKGLAIGIGVRIVIHFIGEGSIFRFNAKIIPERDKSITIFLRGPIVFSSWIPLSKHLDRFFKEGKRVTLDISETKFMDRRVMSKVYERAKIYKENGLELSVRTIMRSIDE